jgi:hypothetical protein
MNMRPVYLAVGLVLGAGACWLGQRALIASRESGCNVESHTKTAPGGDFRATLTYKTCGWGFGLAANFSSVKLEKLGANGWSQNIDLETDEPPAESPTMEWTDSSHLEMVIKSDHISGSIQIAEHGLHFTRRYVTAK